jgi:hypothetical protein
MGRRFPEYVPPNPRLWDNIKSFQQCINRLWSEEKFVNNWKDVFVFKYSIFPKADGSYVEYTSKHRNGMPNEVEVKVFMCDELYSRGYVDVDIDGNEVAEPGSDEETAEGTDRDVASIEIVENILLQSSSDESDTDELQGKPAVTSGDSKSSEDKIGEEVVVEGVERPSYGTHEKRKKKTTYKKGDVVLALYIEGEGEDGDYYVASIVKVFQLIDDMTTQFYSVKDASGGTWTVSEDQIKPNTEQYRFNI